MPDRADDGNPGEGRPLALLRTARDLDQEDVALRAGMTQDAVSRIEHGLRDPGPETRERLLEALRCSPADLKRTSWWLDSLPEETGEPAAPVKPARLALEGLGFVIEHQARARLARRTGPTPPTGRREAVLAWNALRTFAVGSLRRIIGDVPELLTPAFWEVLCTESERAARFVPERAAGLAELAVDMAAWIVLPDERHRPEYRAHALDFLANALRVQGRLPRAEETFRLAEEHWPAGSPAASALDPTRRLDLRASLLYDHRHLPDALALLDQALQQGPRGPTGRARVLIKKAKVHEELKQPEVALAFLEEAAPLLPQEAEPFLVYSHRNLVVVNLWLAGQPEEAERRLGEVQALAEELGNDLDKLRLFWLEARLDAALGRRLDAIEKMRRVRAGFQDRKIPFDTALATLELAALLLEQGETAEVKELAEEMLATFAEQEVPQEAEKALRIFCEAAVQETITVELVRRVLAEVERG